MKKTLLIPLFLFLILFQCFADEIYLDNLEKGVKLYGYVDEYCNLFISPIEADSAVVSGMPFDITGTDVKFNASDLTLGRQIAYWSFATNMPSIKLTFSATPLTSEDSSEYAINYYMTFKYNFWSLSSTGTLIENAGYITVHSGYNTTEKTFSNNVLVGGLPLSLPIISMDNDIRFMFDETAPTSFSSYPSGYYSSTVNIYLEGI